MKKKYSGKYHQEFFLPVGVEYGLCFQKDLTKVKLTI